MRSRYRYHGALNVHVQCTCTCALPVYPVHVSVHTITTVCHLGPYLKGIIADIQYMYGGFFCIHNHFSSAAPSLSGHPGDFQRVGGLRLDECSTYGCLLELTIQLGIIFVGKQILNNATELGIP